MLRENLSSLHDYASFLLKEIIFLIREFSFDGKNLGFGEFKLVKIPASIGKIMDFFHLKKSFYNATNLPMQFPPHGHPSQEEMFRSQDPIRYQMIALAINQIKRENISGAFAEAGVFRGVTSKIIHLLAPERPLYLFDTFTGFPKHLVKKGDPRFDSTSVELVYDTIGDTKNIIIKKGIIPDTFQGLESEKFAFVMLDLDLYESTLAALEFFYSRMNRAGYIFIHDYNSLESIRGVAGAVNRFLTDKSEKVIELPDTWGSVVFRKVD